MNAEMDAYKIKKDRPVNHPMNLFMALSLASSVALVQGWLVGLTLLFLIPLVFDQYLNVRRGKPFNYQSKSTGSIIDKIENFLFQKYAWYASNAIYLACFIAGTILSNQ